MRKWQEILDITEYTLSADIASPVCFALIADVHASPAEDVVAAVRERRPDAALLAGDILERPGHTGPMEYSFLESLTKLCPVFYAPGNHEYREGDLNPESDVRARTAGTGAVMLVNESVRFRDMVIGGLHPEFGLSKPSEMFLGEFEKENGYRILICHEPERYKKYVRKYKIPMVVSGHAHGGQVRIFRHGLFAPGQGILPKYTEGIHENRLIISRGLGNHTWAPRVFNHRELCFVTLLPKNGK